jgi:murein DD-endopeptidase MepM/ murein hydrolase activator NlpD
MRRVTGRYDASADYWRLTADGGLEYDGDGWLRDANGEYIRDDNGNRIGAKTIEAGLLNILGIDPKDKAAVVLAQKLMTDAGIQHTGGDDPDKWYWDRKDIKESNMGKTIGFGAIVAGGYGNTVNTAVFMNGFDRSTDAFVFGNTFAKIDEMNGTPDYVLGRYLNYASAKGAFYSAIQALVGGETRISGPYKDKFDETLYINYNNYHYGIDIAGIEGIPVYAGISGKVIDNPQLHEREGYSVRMEYGYQFEGFTKTTGIVGEYLHLQSKSNVVVGQFVSANTQIGALGNTGSVSTGPHLHYTVYTDPQKKSHSNNVLTRIFGSGIGSTSMTNNTKSKTVYDSTYFYTKNQNKY